MPTDPNDAGPIADAVAAEDVAADEARRCAAAAAVAVAIAIDESDQVPIAQPVAAVQDGGWNAFARGQHLSRRLTYVARRSRR